MLGDDRLIGEGLFIYESLDDPTPRRSIAAEPMPDMDNISWKWLPDNIATDFEGSHNGNNYIAHTFYIENRGIRNFTYWMEVNLDVVTREIDEGIRIMIFQDFEPTVYAKKNRITGEPETVPPITVPFLEDRDNTIILRERSNFLPGDIDRYTIVIWIEGDDPDTLDPMLGGILRMHMRIIGELVN